MARPTRHFGRPAAVLARIRRHAGPLLLCAALGGAAQAHAQADPACYVVNQLLVWLQAQATPIECARAPATAAAGTAKAPGAAAAPAEGLARLAPAALHVQPTFRRQP
ncbi:hypothetical protein [Pseudorhodoferax sp.]|uniref:hypothetical protein n=1 Tax=Pseudorhodoferax sp. TaxID=1993553 RepID=UPI002DD6331E|nr:hypothetical protein [Pseudorhodoferax sp.]